MFSVSCELFVGLGVFFVIQPLSFLVFQETYVETSYLCGVNFIKIGMSYNLLKGKKGIIFGALNEQSIAWKVAEKAVEEGATITLSNTPVAVRMGEVSALAEKLHCEVIPADATSVEDLENVFKRSMEVLGGPVDFVLHSI